MSPALISSIGEFYVSQSVYTSPGALVGHYAELPEDPAEMARIVRNLMIHRVEGPLFGYDIPLDRLRDDAETRYIDDILRLILGRDPAPLGQARPVEHRFVGVCRDMALLLCSFLRHHGVPARVRSGFADYWGDDGFCWDHMVCEYWSPRRGWLLADPQLADLRVTEKFGVSLDPMDVPRDRFVVAAKAWRAIRAGTADPANYGLRLPGQSLIGVRFIAGNVRLDLAALNKVETLLWDVWGRRAENDEAMTEADHRLYDRAAKVTGDDVPFEQVRALFDECDELRTPRTVLCAGEFHGPVTVTLRTPDRYA